MAEELLRGEAEWDDGVRFVLGELIRIGLSVLGADQGSLLLVDEKGEKLRFAMVRSRVGGEEMARMEGELIGKSVPIGEGLTGMAALTRDVQTATRTESDWFYSVKGDGTPHAVLAAPMLIGDELVGVVTAVSFDGEKSFSAEDCVRYGHFANVAAAVLGMQRRFDAQEFRSLGSVMGGAGDETSGIVAEVRGFAQRFPQKVPYLLELVKACSRLAN